MKSTPAPHWRREQVELFVLQPDDVSADYVDWLNDPLVNRFLESRFMRHTEATTRDFVRQCADDPGALFLGIRSLALDGRHVGNIKLAPIDTRHGLAEVGILVGHRQAWGRGIASAAIAITADIARNDLGLRKLTAGCYASNLGSVKAFQRAGFELEGERRDHFLLDGQPEAMMLMARWLAPAATRA